MTLNLRQSKEVLLGGEGRSKIYVQLKAVEAKALNDYLIPEPLH